MVNIAFEGCCHGELDKIYRSLAKLSVPIDLLIIAGDFQAVRNSRDLKCMAVPAKYQQLGDFHSYYSGQKVAPITTIFIGGNHEASNYLWELYYGGWVAPNIYYMGASVVLNFCGVRIGGLSGIWKEGDYHKGHFERVPYTEGTKRSIYHVRQYDVLKLYQISEPVDIVVSHDWPAGVEHFGRLNELLTKKKFLKSDIDNKALGSPPAMRLLERIRPRFWLSAHLHVKYTAIVKHKPTDQRTSVSTDKTSRLTQYFVRNSAMPNGGQNANGNADERGIGVDECVINEDEINLDIFSGQEGSNSPDGQVLVEDRDDDLATDIPSQQLSKSLGEQAEPTESSSHVFENEQVTSREYITDEGDNGFPETRFLALDKCLPRREFLQVIRVPTREHVGAHRICYDPEWLAITKATEPYMSLDQSQTNFFATASEQEALKESIRQAREWVQKYVVEVGKLEIPSNFIATAPCRQADDFSTSQFQPVEYNNTQTQDFCDLLGIPNRIWRE
ncbi:lariat debranching enzyme, C-terminal domain-containing protein [Lipomyces kononenkoae]